MTAVIDIINQCDDANIPQTCDIERYLNTVLSNQNMSDAEISVAIVSKDDIQQLNRDYRQKDKPTNVLSFPAELPEGIDCHLLGDIVICAEVVAEEATLQNKEPASHWAHMLVHGCLHLLGFDHIDDNDAEQMEALEINILQQLGFNNPYIL